MPARTLAQAIDHLAALAGTFDTNAGPVLSPLLAACREVGEARTRLDGLEEARAMMAARGSAFEQARELLEITDAGELGARLAEVVNLAAFLSPGNEVLEDPNIIDITHRPEPDPIADAELEDRSELEASQAGALAQVDELTDKVAALERSNETKNATLRVSEELVERLEAELTTEKAEGDVAREHVTELATTLEATERELAEERTKVIDLTERAAQWQKAAHYLNPLFGGPSIADELPDLDTLNRFGVGLHGDRIAFVVIGQELDRDEALVMAAHTVALADRGEGRFAAIYRKVCNA